MDDRWNSSDLCGNTAMGKRKKSMEKGKERILTRIKGRVPCVKAGTLFFCTRP